MIRPVALPLRGGFIASERAGHWLARDVMTERRREERDEALNDVCRLRGELFALRESLGTGAPY